MKKDVFIIFCLFVLYVHVAIASSVQERLDNRNFPSIFMTWGFNMNLPPSVSPRENVAYHDWILGPRGLLKFERTAQGVELVGDTALAKSFGITKDPFDFTRQALNDYKSYNPNILTILDVPMLLLRFHDEYDFFFLDLFPKDSDYWIRDANGSYVTTPFGESLIDFTHPEVQDIIIQIAVAVDNSGIWDGIFFDIWNETGVVLKGYRTLEAEKSARSAILERIRNAVSDDFLILVNGNWKTAKNAAPYINGIFWESFRGASLDNYSYESMKWFEKNLLWAENNLREPRMNSLEAEGIGSQSPLSPENQRAMRCITTLNLTHSDGFVLYTMGVQWNESHQHDATFRNPFVDHLSDINHGHGQDPQGLHHIHHHQHYWYDFWDADLGQPMSKKGQLYEGTEGLFIREFTNGWAVYNRSGKEQIVKLPVKSSGVESGVPAIEHTIPDLDGEIYLKVPVVVADVNSDGVVNIQDLVIVAGKLGVENPSHADVNGDGVVNILDLVSVAQEIQ